MHCVLYYTYMYTCTHYVKCLVRCVALTHMKSEFLLKEVGVAVVLSESEENRLDQLLAQDNEEVRTHNSRELLLLL